MLIAAPVDEDRGLDSPIAGHFGRTPYYAMVDPEGETCAVMPNGSSHNGGTLLPPQWLAEHGVQVLLCGGLGARAIQLCEGCGIAVYVGQEATVREFLAAFKAGRLPCATLEDGCTHHERLDAGTGDAGRHPRCRKD